MKFLELLNDIFSELVVIGIGLVLVDGLVVVDHQVLAVVREQRIDLGQLQNRYGNNLWAEIIGNCDIQLMLGCTDDVSAEYFSARSGDISVEVDSTMTVRRTIAVAQVIPQYRHTEGQGKRRLLTPDEVLRLPNDELLCIVRGCNILKLRKFDYTNHPMARQIRRVSVYDYEPHPGLVYSPPAAVSPSPAASSNSTNKALLAASKPPSDY